MAIRLKSKEEIDLMREGGRRLRQVVSSLMPKIKPGITTNYLDRLISQYISKLGGAPSFQTVSGYRWASCLSINEQAVHTPPSDRLLKDGDLLTVDVGMLYHGYHTDFALTLVVGQESNPELQHFLSIGQEALMRGIKQARVGNRLGHISKEIEQTITSAGYFILKDLTGHGIGTELHEDPYVFNYLNQPIDKTIPIKPGLVIAIEVIYSQGTTKITYESKNGWSIKTADNSLSACFEHTVAIDDKNTYILT